jgi:hypothetical protein
VKTVTTYRFIVTSKPGEKPYRTRYHLTELEAADRYATAVPVLETRIVRELPESADELAAIMQSAGRDGAR